MAGDAGIPARARHCRGRGRGIQSRRSARGARGVPLGLAGAVIVALRYGPLAGLGAGAVLLLAWVALHVGHMDQFPRFSFWAG